MKNSKDYKVFNLYEDDYPPAADGKVESTVSQVSPGSFGPSVTTGGLPGAISKPGEMNIGGSPETPRIPGGDINIGGNK